MYGCSHVVCVRACTRARSSTISASHPSPCAGQFATGVNAVIRIPSRRHPALAGPGNEKKRIFMTGQLRPNRQADAARRTSMLILPRGGGWVSSQRRTVKARPSNLPHRLVNRCSRVLFESTSTHLQITRRWRRQDSGTQRSFPQLQPMSW